LRRPIGFSTISASISASGRFWLSFDGTQRLSIDCPEAIREPVDEPPHYGPLFAGTHKFAKIFTR
jgi:hypothetical protein